MKKYQDKTSWNFRFDRVARAHSFHDGRHGGRPNESCCTAAERSVYNRYCRYC